MNPWGKSKFELKNQSEICQFSSIYQKEEQVLKIARFLHQGKVKYGIVEDQTIMGYRGNPFSNPNTGRVYFKADGSKYPFSEVKLLAPSEPSKIVCLGLNYRKHIEEMGSSKTPESPILFLKPPSSIINPEEYVVRPDLPVKGKVDYEGEAGVVIGKKAKDVPEDLALQYILGYTCVNDVSARYAQRLDGQWTRGKGFDTFCPIGPWTETEADPANLKIETLVNGQIRQNSDTSYLIFKIPYLISFISAVMTLMPGDVIVTGTPEGVGEMNPGDKVEVQINGVGTLRHFVKDKN
jgi:2-keto-4-pentenoate hydratase/2-oxohepta-3-ene-1,7-dioic acid hydratase in catechol pathway